MTETEWLAASDPRTMLEHLGPGLSQRKARLFAVACCRRIWHLMRQKHGRRAVEMAEAVACGRLGPAEHAAAWQEAWDADGRAAARNVNVRMAVIHASAAGIYALHYRTDEYPGWAETASNDAVLAVTAAAQEDHHLGADVGDVERRAQADLLREIFGNPARRVRVLDEWLLANEGAVRKLAQTISDERIFALLPILADALEDAGCRDAAIVSHCRASGPHVPGCWVVDLLLGMK
jgi:hypothetical protein